MGVFLSKPENGWATIILGDVEYHISYVTNVPLDILNNAIISLREDIPFAINFNLEALGDLYLLSDYPHTYLIQRNNDIYFNAFEINKEELIEQLTGSIKKNLDDWSIWQDDEVNKNKEVLTKKIKEIEKLLLDYKDE